MNTFNSIWKKLGKSKRYREQFVADHAKRAIPHQARAILKTRGWSQQKLAQQANLSQGVVSRAVDPSYGNLTLNTIIRIAAGFDVAFIGRFVPFSELARWYADLPDETFDIPAFEQEQEQEAGLQQAAISGMTVRFQPKSDPIALGTATNDDDLSSATNLGPVLVRATTQERMHKYG